MDSNETFFQDDPFLRKTWPPVHTKAKFNNYALGIAIGDDSCIRPNCAASLTTPQAAVENKGMFRICLEL